ncbi:MAG: CRISPR-associated protein Cas4 [Planctomycetota bacterium]
MYAEDDLLPLSALQHLLFCERQCALIHIEQVWDDNRFTVEGALLHQRVDEQGPETRGDLHIARGVRLRSLRLGLVGRADVVEFHRVGDRAPPETQEVSPGVPLRGTDGLWRPFPVEYKRGRPKPDRSDEVQLCAQALCLEEMLAVDVPEGALFYGKTRRRLAVAFDESLRAETETAAARLRTLFESRETPKPERSKKCQRCSLAQLCLPKAARGRSAARYLRDALAEHQEGP